MFEMKSASFAVNDRTLLHPPAFASSKVGSMASSATTGQANRPDQTAGAPATPQRRGEILFDDQPLSAWEPPGSLPVRWPICPSTCRVPKPARPRTGGDGALPWRGLLGRMGSGRSPSGWSVPSP